MMRNMGSEHLEFRYALALRLRRSTDGVESSALAAPTRARGARRGELFTTAANV